MHANFGEFLTFWSKFSTHQSHTCKEQKTKKKVFPSTSDTSRVNKSPLSTCEPPKHVFMIIELNDSLIVTHWHCPPEILSKIAWFTKPLERRGKKSHWGDGLLRGFSSRPINHSLIRAHWEWGCTLRSHISGADFQLSEVLLPDSDLLASPKQRRVDSNKIFCRRKKLMH